MTYQGTPFQDEHYQGGPQQIPGKVMCAYYDFGGEGIAYHDTIKENQGSGMLNPSDGSYLHEFRKNESVDTSYTKFFNETDNSPYNLVTPDPEMLYVGWTEPGEWIKYTVSVLEDGDYQVSLLYTSNCGGSISISIDDEPSSDVLPIPSTYDANDPVDWRQWHHWNLATNLTTLRLQKGIHILTLKTIEHGNMNYAYLDFSLIK